MDSATERITSRIKGIGVDTFRTILINVKRVSKMGGDCYAEKIRDKAGRLINLKLLNPGTIRIEANEFGIIKQYVQVATNNLRQIKILNTFDPEQIFNIANDRLADEIHGIPELEKLYDIIKWRHQSMSDLATVFHRYVFPILEIYAKTDDPTELADLEAKYTKSMKNMESRIIPAGAVEKVERVSIPQHSTLDPLPWNIFLRSYFTESSNVPDLIRGKSDEVSLAAGKLNYLGFKEKIEMEQLEYAEQIKSQLGITLEFEKPQEIDIEIAQDNRNIEERRSAKENKEVVSGRAV